MRFATTASALALLLTGCGGGGTDGTFVNVTPTPTPTPAPSPSPTASPTPTPTTTAVTRTVVASLDNPWAMVFLPDGRLLVTERTGTLRVVTTAGAVSTPVTGVPAVAVAGQGGLLDVALDPAFAANNRIYLSYAETGALGGRGLAVARATLAVGVGSGGGALSGVQVIWRQGGVMDDRHYGGRMAFAPDGTLYITSGERHQGAPAQDDHSILGKIARINSDGTIPAGNPITDPNAGASPLRGDIWTRGHRNPYGLVFAQDGRLFESEMGPDAGDEFNLITIGANYGWPLVAEGSDGGVAIPSHSTRPAFAAPLKSWNPNIAPAGMIQYRGSRFVGWSGDFILAALVQQGIVRVRVTGSTAAEAARIGLGARIREVEEGPDGAIWVLEDGSGGRLIRLDPA